MELYPSLRKAIGGQFRQFESVEFESIVLKDNGEVEVFAKSNNGIQLFFVLQEEGGDYKVVNSKGLSVYNDSNLYEYCKRIGCITTGAYDLQIDNVCKQNESSFNNLVNQIKNRIEATTRLESHSVKVMGYGDNYATGNITLKNFTRFTIPAHSYKLYVNYLDSDNNILFTSDKSLSNFEAIGFGQSKTIHVIQDISSEFRKVNIKLKLLSTQFIEEIVAKHSEGSSCLYSGNL